MSSHIKVTKRQFTKGVLTAGVGLTLLPKTVFSQSGGLDLSVYKKAKINWRQVEGERITVAVIPAGYFNNLDVYVSDFERLTGIKVRVEKIPPGQIRQKAVLDLSGGTATYATHSADPMYYSLYSVNEWVESLDPYLADSSLTDQAWYDVNDIFPSWRQAVSVNNQLLGMPFDGETTIQVYRKDVYDKLGLKPADTLDEYLENAKRINDPSSRLWGAALRGFRGAGQNMYIFPSILVGYGGKWFDNSGKIQVNTPEARSALEWYTNLLSNYSPDGVKNWNWPDIAGAFGQATLGSYIDANGSAAIIADPKKSIVAGKIGYARWPKGPANKRCSSIWNWSFPINASLTEKQKKATWLFIQWATSKPTQIATSYKFSGTYKRVGVNRQSLWSDSGFEGVMSKLGDNFIQASKDSYDLDTDANWRPRLPQWPAVGDIMATAIQSSLIGQSSAKDALQQAQSKIEKVIKS